MSTILSFLVLRGLYGQVSFLLALGTAVLCAFLFHNAGLLIHKRHRRLGSHILKADAHLTLAGRVLLLAAIVVLAFLSHSAWLQVQGLRAQNLLEHNAEISTEQSQNDLITALGLAEYCDRFGLLNDHRVLTTIARCNVKLGQPEQAQQAYARAMSAAPRNLGLKFETARLNMQLGQSKTAEALFREILAKDPSLARVGQELAGLLTQKGLPVEAAKVYKAMAMHQSDSHYWLGLAGNQWAMAGELDSAMTAWQDALALKSTYRPAKLRLLEAHFERQEYTSGFALLNDLLIDSPKDVSLHVLACKASIAAQRQDEAQKHLELIRRFAPGHPELVYLKQLLGGTQDVD